MGDFGHRAAAMQSPTGWAPTAIRDGEWALSGPFVLAMCEMVGLHNRQIDQHLRIGICVVINFIRMTVSNSLAHVLPCTHNAAVGCQAVQSHHVSSSTGKSMSGLNPSTYKCKGLQVGACFARGTFVQSGIGRKLSAIENGIQS